MSGHSKWANIRVRKGAQDARRGKIYTKHAKLVEIAAQRGGDPSTNAGLRAAIDNAKADNVPNANIDRAIKKGTGELKGDRMEEVLYAAMGPGGVACIIECMSDNKNRTLSNVKIIISKHGGAFSESASVLWMFARKGVVMAKEPAGGGQKKLEEMELELIDFGAEDVEQDGEILTITTDLHNWGKIRDFLKSNNWEVESAGMKYVPTQKTSIDAETAEKLVDFIAAIEEDDDVTEVHTNAELA
jgi:YebC/PmpR family DNA-binding regulatory protein